MANFIENSLLIMTSINIIGVMLIMVRPDRLTVLKDLKNMFIVKKVYLFITTLLLTFFILIPFSIPFSIIQIVNGGEDY